MKNSSISILSCLMFLLLSLYGILLEKDRLIVLVFLILSSIAFISYKIDKLSEYIKDKNKDKLL